ncbi:hypothetical protein CTAYLR_004293 [Chrysophaeum taylorii]|uniref:Palmitoyltransferase n=1 Tax=Chrysophaeum taylorii TaxID=2483200 RepID=A0AAD7UDV2_9STRA|nr:hypothetical protein CTAYLR_004293 [Chrysophaeum taylorii]
MAARVNGFDRPFHPLQVFTWCLFPCILFGFYGVVVPVLPPVIGWATGTLYTTIALTTFVSAWITSAIEPKDPHVPGRRNSCECLALGHTTRDADLIRCYLCDSHVYSTSKHCRFCDKCVLRFDHHCKWLNTCVGQKNYAYFVCVIASTWAFSTLQLALTAYVLGALVFGYGDVSSRANNTYLGGAYIIVASVWTALLVPLVCLVGQLVLFHVMLVWQGLTTYEYILNEQRREEDDDQDDDTPHGRVNKSRWLWSLYLNYGSTATAVFVAVVSGSLLETKAAFGMACGYVTWFASIAALATLNFLGEVSAGTEARAKYEEHAWLGTALLEFFSVRADVRGGQAFVDVLVTASLLPAIVAGFVAFWFVRAHYALRCSPSVDNSDLCNAINGNRVCCRVVNAKYDPGSFLPNLVAYVLAGYTFAYVLVRLLIARHRISGEQLKLNDRSLRHHVMTRGTKDIAAVAFKMNSRRPSCASTTTTSSSSSSSSCSGPGVHNNNNNNNNNIVVEEEEDVV